MKFKGVYILFLVIIVACSDNNESVGTAPQYVPTPLALDIPQLFSDNIIAPVIPIINPQTVEGVALGKKLFFDPILSRDNTISCASCHAPQHAFTDNAAKSVGVNGAVGTRNSMPLFNLAWNYDDRFAWDGKELGLERQALEPIANPTEMHNPLPEVIQKLQADADYPLLFNQAFGAVPITPQLVGRALAQFERTLISANSKFDRYSLGLEQLTAQELNGLDIFLREDKGDCFHCHGNPNNPLWTDNAFHNNGLDATFTDLGFGAVTGDPADNGKFRSPSLRNLAYTAPYMHDGRFATLDEVIDHYSEGLVASPTIDPLMKKVDEGGVQLTAQEKADLKAFLLTLSDPSFISNPAFSN